MTRAQDPKGAAQTTQYDSAGRVKRVTNAVNGAYSRMIYPPSQTILVSATTVNDLAHETFSFSVFDGAGRVRASAADFPIQHLITAASTLGTTSWAALSLKPIPPRWAAHGLRVVMMPLAGTPALRLTIGKADHWLLRIKTVRRSMLLTAVAGARAVKSSR